jgi:hypothetical protein
VPSLEAWGGFRLGTTDLGPPVSSCGTSAIFHAPAGLPPGSIPVAHATGGETGVTTTLIQISADVAMDVIQRGGSTPMTLQVVGTERALPARITNRTPGIITLEGGVEQHVATSGGASNSVVRTVTGISPGGFAIDVNVTLPNCPCDVGAEKVASQAGDLFMDLAKGWNQQLGGKSATPPPPGEETLLLLGGRFKVGVDWRNGDGLTGPGSGQVAPRGDDTGFFFFSPDNTELVVKILNACDLNSRYWVFAGATTNVEYTLTVTDTQLGTTKAYTNPLGQAAPAVTDTSAFATCP